MFRVCLSAEILFKGVFGSLVFSEEEGERWVGFLLGVRLLLQPNMRKTKTSGGGGRRRR